MNHANASSLPAAASIPTTARLICMALVVRAFTFFFPDDCGQYDDLDFSLDDMCCACAGRCIDTDDGATDMWGAGCDAIFWNPDCGRYDDDDDFSANAMCCICMGWPSADSNGICWTTETTPACLSCTTSLCITASSSSSVEQKGILLTRTGCIFYPSLTAALTGPHGPQIRHRSRCQSRIVRPFRSAAR